jgi:hypothetical protein
MTWPTKATLYQQGHTLSIHSIPSDWTEQRPYNLSQQADLFVFSAAYRICTDS